MIAIYEELYDEIAFTPPSLRDARVRRAKAFARRADEVVRPREEFKSEEYLMLAHTREYVELLKKFANVEGPTPLDRDTHAYPGFFDHVLTYVAGTLTALEVALERGHAFNPVGGLHHARRSRSGGFCPANDLAIAALYAHERGLRVAIFDYDGHHGDGTQEILYEKPILHISVHDYGIYPGTGRIDELGSGEGLGYNVNIPLAHYSSDASAAMAADLAGRLLENYNPDVIIVQSGADGRHGDPLTTLRYTAHAFRTFGETLRKFYESGTKLVFTGGGGYTERVPDLRTIAYSSAIGRPAEPFEESREDRELEENASRIAALVERLKKLGFLRGGLLKIRLRRA